MNRSSYSFQCRLKWYQGTMCQVEVRIPSERCSFGGIYRPIMKNREYPTWPTAGGSSDVDAVFRCQYCSNLLTRNSATVDILTDRTTPCVSWNLVNCCTTVGTRCTTNPEQIGAMVLEGCSRPKCNKLCASSHDALYRRRCNPHAWPSTSLVDTINLLWRSFLSPEFGTNVQMEAPLFWRYLNFLIGLTQIRIGHRKQPCQNQLCLSSRFDRIPACNEQASRRTDRQTHEDSIYTALA